MNSYLVSYDLIAPNKDYSSLISAIKEYNGFARVLESCWIVKSNDGTTAIRDNLKSHMDSNDKLFVAKLTGEASWKSLTTEVSNWLHNNL